jgi:hypothetical protein
MATIIIGTITLLAFTLAIWKLIRDGKKGSSVCGSCGACSSASTCGKKYILSSQKESH